MAGHERGSHERGRSLWFCCRFMEQPLEARLGQQQKACERIIHLGCVFFQLCLVPEVFSTYHTVTHVFNVSLFSFRFILVTIFVLQLNTLIVTTDNT